MKPKHKLELLWWIFTAILAVAVLLPIALNVPDFPFYFPNILYIVIFVTFVRYIFLLKHTFLARRQWLKLLIIGFATITVFVLIMSIGDFNNYLEEIGLQELVSHLSFPRQNSMMGYMKNEMIFFGVGSVISAVVLPLRMLISIWRVRNRGTV